MHRPSQLSACCISIAGSFKSMMSCKFAVHAHGDHAHLHMQTSNPVLFCRESLPCTASLYRHVSTSELMQASISDLARGAGQENQQKEHREGHLLMQVSRVLQRRLQLATSSSTHSFLSAGSRSLTSVSPCAQQSNALTPQGRLVSREDRLLPEFVCFCACKLGTWKSLLQQPQS